MNTQAVQQPRSRVPSTFVPWRCLLLQRKCACGGSTGESGKCDSCRSRKGLQAKLAVIPARKYFTPMDCWGSQRIKIEDGKEVVTPAGRRNNLHSGNPAEAVSSCCVKSLDDGVFQPIRSLTGGKGAVPFCEGATCTPVVNKAITTTIQEGLADLAKGVNRLLP